MLVCDGDDFGGWIDCGYGFCGWEAGGGGGEDAAAAAYVEECVFFLRFWLACCGTRSAGGET